MIPRPKTKINLGLDLEFNSIHFGIEILKIFDTQKCLGLKNVRKILEDFKKFFLEFSQNSEICRPKHFLVSKILNVC